MTQVEDDSIAAATALPPATGTETLVCVGISHRTASLAQRERFALGPRRAQQVRRRLYASDGIYEVVVLATCNRTEIYCVADNTDAVFMAIDASGLLATPLSSDPVFELLSETSVAAHLASVAAGLESVVLGEAQIQGQVRSALGDARSDGCVGPILDRLFATALRVGKRARADTDIGSGNASVASVGAAIAASVVGDLAQCTVMIVGAGKLGSLVATCLHQHTSTQVLVSNRDAVRAAHLAEQFSARTVRFEAMQHELATCDVAIFSTAAPHHVLDVERITQALAARKAQQRADLVIIDLAVPRDVDPAVGTLDGVQLFDLDDIERAVAETSEQRAAARAAVSDMVEAEAASFVQWRRGRSVEPTISRLRAQSDQALDDFYTAIEPALEDVSPAQRRRIRKAARSLVGGLLHDRITAVRLRARQEHTEL